MKKERFFPPQSLSSKFVTFAENSAGALGTGDFSHKLAKDHRTGRSLNFMCLIDHTEEAGQGSTPKKKEACTEADFRYNEEGKPRTF